MSSAGAGRVDQDGDHGRVELHEPPSDLICSARGCGAAAQWALRWNNPRLHTPERRKTWLACEQHRSSLSEHLSVRGFLRETEPVSALASDRAGA
jgi:hypothetical protein